MKESYLGIDGKKTYEMVYENTVHGSTDAIVVKGTGVPKLVVRTDGEEWRVISSMHTWSASEPSIREQRNELDSDPLTRSTKFRKANRILFVSVRNEPQTLRFYLPFGDVQILELRTDGLGWISSRSMINGREATREQRKAIQHAIPLSEPTSVSAIPRQCLSSSES